MKRLLLSLAATAIALSAATAQEDAGSFKGVAGLQLYSLRNQFKEDVPGTLDKVKSLGFTEVETYTTHGMPAEEFRKMLEERGLKPVSSHFQYEVLGKDIAAVIKDARALGVRYVACPWIPHEPAQFTEEIARKAASDFNQWGEAISKAGLKFAYHPHGYEFVPAGDGTLLDVMMRETNPKFVTFQMDVFWVVHPGQDPVKLLRKYPDRWELMHLKDIRIGARTGVFTGKAPHTDGVALGTGQVNWPAVLREAAKAGVKHYFIEDEAPTVLEQLPVSLKYLESLK